VLGAGFVLVRPHLTERQRRLLYGAFALVLGQAGHPVSPTTVGRLLHAQAKAYLAARQPVVSVDTRKGT
jgi:hypothetical protein